MRETRAYNLLRSDSFTDIGNGEPNITGLYFRHYALQVVGRDVEADSWLVVLEGSLDGVNYDTILTHATGDGNGKIAFSGNQIFPAKWVRSRVHSLTLGSAASIEVYIMSIK